MGNRPFILPDPTTKKEPALFDWGSLKNRFSGKTLFRLKLYNLVTGDLSVLDIVNNKWFIEELLTYCRSAEDINLLPALKKIAGSVRFDESHRQRASEIAEIAEDKEFKKKSALKTASDVDDSARIESARKILAGTRSPQTTEVLRLLRDKSPEFKRLGLFLIGKFKMPDMIQEACECLGINEIEDDAYSVLLDLGPSAAKEINKYCLTASGNIISRKTLLRLLSRVTPAAEMSFLADHLGSSSRQIKEMVLDSLVDSKYQTNENEKERLKKNIYDTFGTLAWIIAALVSLQNSKDTLLPAEMNKEYVRWKNYILKLLSITFDDRIPVDNKKKMKGETDDLTKSLLEMAGVIYDNNASRKKVDPSDPAYFKKKLKKLQRWFPCEIPEYKSLPEDIINCDYNLISVWTKACTLRSIPEITEEDLAESVVALLFSPEEVLREESARLIARSGRELYRTTAERVPLSARSKIDRIVAGEVRDNELVCEKARFLYSCFPELNEEELLFLAEKTSYEINYNSEIWSHPGGTILWTFREGKTAPDVFINHEETADTGKHVKDIMNKCSFCYLLPLNAVREFNFQYPEKSFGIFKYIDRNEE